MSDVNIRGSWLKGLQELSTIFVNLKFLQNIKKKLYSLYVYGYV